MWLLRLLRHPVMIVCLFGHASLVIIWVFVCCLAELTEWSLLFLGGFLLSLAVLLLDCPVFWIASCYFSKPILKDVFSVHGDFFRFALYILVFGSVQWGLMGLLLTVPDLMNRSRR